MSDFFKKFLLEDSRKFSDSGRYVALAAFGKHPGWDDHIGPLPGRITVADLGLETESLNLATTVFYVNGIGGQIDSGAWEKLDSTQQLSFFKHVFVWQRSGQILIGRLWSSSDGQRTEALSNGCVPAFHWRHSRRRIEAGACGAGRVGGGLCNDQVGRRGLRPARSPTHRVAQGDPDH